MSKKRKKSRRPMSGRPPVSAGPTPAHEPPERLATDPRSDEAPVPPGDDNTVHPRPDVLARAVLGAVSSGRLDPYLRTIAAAVRTRLGQQMRKTEVEAAARFEVGDRVQLDHNVRPKYLHGEFATVTGWAAKNVLVQLDRPTGRFAAGEVSVPPLALVRVGELEEGGSVGFRPW